MTTLRFSYQFPWYVSDSFQGKAKITCTFAKEGFHQVKIEQSADQQTWKPMRSTVINLSGTYDFVYAEEGLFYRLSVRESPILASYETIVVVDPISEDDVKNIVNETVSPVAKTGKAEDLNLTAVTGLLATQVQAAIAELLAKITALGAAIFYEGQVDDYASLPTEDLKKGQMWNVVAAYGDIPAGTNYVWNGTEWDSMVGQIDLSPFLKSAEAAETYLAKSSAVNTYVPLAANATTSGSDVVRLLAVNSAGKAISVTPKIIGDYIVQSLLDYDLLAISKS